MAAEPVTWIRKDFHVHESHSSDAPGATVEKYCRVAERRGIDEVAFTTHFIIAGEERVLEKILSEFNLDIVLGSLHYIRGVDIGSRRNSPRFFKRRPVEESLNIYYEGFREAVESGLFDVMAHPDYFRKYLPLSRPEPVTWEEYGTTVYGAIDSLKSYGVGIGVNSSGYRHGINDVYPIRGFLEAAREAGVDKVTVGSDSHSADGLGVNTVMALRRLEEAGYGHLCVYEDRKNRRVDLEDVKF